MAEHNPITKLTSQGEYFDLGANFKNVYLNDSDDFSLEDLYNHYKQLISANLFAAYDENEPGVYNVNVWYDISEENIPN